VADAYKLDRQTKHTCKPLGAIAYDERILAWRLTDKTVSLWTVAGSLRLPSLGGERQLALLESLQGEADPVCRDGACYLYQTDNAAELPPAEPADFLGLELGIFKLAAGSFKPYEPHSNPTPP
jgi:putative transposase